MLPRGSNVYHDAITSLSGEMIPLATGSSLVSADDAKRAALMKLGELLTALNAQVNEALA